MTDNDDQHRQLARGAFTDAMAQRETLAEYDEFDLTLPTSDVVNEAIGAWLGTGLVHESYSERDLREITSAIVGRVATVLALVGWQPPARLLEGGGEADQPPTVRQSEDKIRDLWNVIQIFVTRYPGCETTITAKELEGRSDLGVVVVSDPEPDGSVRLKVRQR
ncbi:hypothetical protein [Lentzea cavernae]|uniref:hypothetical protein n=1 Tax=Lentzea cavernae TaxID=2020703 RepID=UPI00174829E1|nr:hypothetical protein [Lentzea cavernae]